jgi:hypothetical protein
VANFTMYRGDTVKLNLAVTSNDVVFDLTDCNLWMTAKYLYADADAAAIFQKTTGGGGILVTSALSGRAQITIDPEDTDDLPNSKTAILYDVQLEDADGLIFTIAYGTITVLPDVTRAITITGP